MTPEEQIAVLEKTIDGYVGVTRELEKAEQRVNALTDVLSEMELHFRGYEDSDGYTKKLFAKAREALR